MQASKEQIEQIRKLGLQALGIYLGKYRGFVEDDNDPENAGRIKVSCPQVWGEGNVLDYWAYPFGMFSGAGFGLVLPPKKGDMIWVEFEGGDPSFPIWTYGHFGRKDKPTEHENNQQYILITPGGTYCKFDDSKDEITINRKNGGKFVLNSKGISIVREGGKIALGQLNVANEPNTLGNKNEAVLTDLANDLKGLIVEFSKLMTAIQTESAANAVIFPAFAPTSATLAGVIATIIPQLTQITANISLLLGVKIAETKSKNVTTD